MTRKGILLFVLVLLGGWSVVGIRAQDSGTERPLIVTGRSQTSGDKLFFRYADGAWELLPAEGVYQGSVSPNSEQLVFLTMPPSLQLESGDGLYGHAWDIALADLGDSSQRDIAVQSEALVVSDDGTDFSGGILRTLPVWSPNSRAFVWTEQDYPARSSARLLAYDLDSDETRVLDDALPSMNMSSDGLPVNFSWGPGGIVVFTNDPADSADTLRYYDAQTGLQQIVRLPPDRDIYGYWYPSLGPLWLMDSANAPTGAAVMAPTLGNGAMYMVDWASGDVMQIAERLVVVSASHPEESLRLIWSFYNGALDPPESLLQLVLPDGTVALTWDDFFGTDDPQSLRRIVFSPAGQAAATLQDGELSIWQEGSRQVVPLPPDFMAADLQWGSSLWQLGEPYDLDAVG